jgi:hypothetical protein
MSNINHEGIEVASFHLGTYLIPRRSILVHDFTWAYERETATTLGQKALKSTVPVKGAGSRRQADRGEISRAWSMGQKSRC